MARNGSFGPKNSPKLRICGFGLEAVYEVFTDLKIFSDTVSHCYTIFLYSWDVEI